MSNQGFTVKERQLFQPTYLLYDEKQYKQLLTASVYCVNFL